MNKFTRKVSFLLLALVLPGFSAAQAAQTFLYLLYDGTRAGEKNQVHGIARALKEHLPEDTIQKEFDLLKEKEAFLADAHENLFKEDSQNKGIILAAEVAGIDVLRQLKPRKNVLIAHSSHQFTKDHTKLKDVADIVALPRYVVTDDVRNAIESPHTVLIQTAGVPHNLSPAVIEEAFQDNKGIIPSAPAYVGVILGGDAETPEGELRYYTAEEAEQLATHVVPQVKEKQSHLLILNGPRTGKHDQNTGKIIEGSHRDGTIDIITKTFKEGLQQQGLSEGKDFTLLDFQFGKPSAYPVVLGALLKTKGPIFVAGESTSMVSETADCLPKGLVTAFTNHAMNENHKKHCNTENEAGRISILENTDGKWRLLEAKETDDSNAGRPASQLIAESIRKRLEEKVLRKTGQTATDSL